MFNLSSYLEKFKNLKDPKENKIILVGIISDVTGISITEEKITIQKGVLFIRSSAFIKNRIFMMKEDVLKKIRELLPDLHITEII